MQMRPHHKVITAVGILLVAYAASVGIGVYRMTFSEAFPMAKVSLAGYLAALKSPDATQSFHLKWFAPWQFSSGPNSGRTQFLLCTPAANCYIIKAHKFKGKWTVSEVIPVR